MRREGPARDLGHLLVWINAWDKSKENIKTPEHICSLGSAKRVILILRISCSRDKIKPTWFLLKWFSLSQCFSMKLSCQKFHSYEFHSGVKLYIWMYQICISDRFIATSTIHWQHLNTEFIHPRYGLLTKVNIKWILNLSSSFKRIWKTKHFRFYFLR